MNSTKLRTHNSLKFSVLAACLAISISPLAAFAQNPASDGAPAAATSPSSASEPNSTGTSQTNASQTGSTPADGSKAKPATKPASVCFKLTGHCVQGSKSGAAANGTSGKSGSVGTGSKPATSPDKPLNLTAPDVRSVVPAEELKEPLPSDTQITETEEADTVSVKGDKNAPDVPGGFGAIWWAMNHPSQAWRILTPAE